MNIEVVTASHAVDAIHRALTGKAVVAVVPEVSPGRYLAALRPDIAVTEPDAAVVVATSGSTGAPKGVVLSQAAIAASVSATHDRLGGAGEWVCALPVEHVAGMMTIARGLLGGQGVVFASGDLSDLPQPAIRSYLSVVPAQLHRALANETLTDRLSGYAAVLVGGQAIPTALLAAAKARQIQVVTTYGMSETCGGCVYDGVPLAGVRVEIEENQRVVLGGPMVFSGYRLESELTREVLVGDTVRTQDRGQFIDGRLQLLGRFDDVVISGGVNVDLAAAQRAADAIWGVTEATRVVLLAIDDERWGTRIVAVTNSLITQDAMIAALSPQLTSAALPRELRQFQSQKVSLAGKIDRVALRAAWEGEDGVNC